MKATVRARHRPRLYTLRCGATLLLSASKWFAPQLPASMATPTADVTEYCSLLSKSKLLPPEEVESIHRRWKDETGSSNDQVEAFGKYLVSKRILTPWQSAMVQRG